MNKMEIILKKVDEIKPYKNNAKLHPKEQIEQIKKSIKDFGNNDPIAIDENNIIIEGHGRYIALKELGYKEVECIVLNNLTEEQKNAYRLVHNKLTMNSDFDLQELENELNKIKDIDMATFDFDMEDIQKQLSKIADLDKEVKEDDFDVDEELKNEVKTQLGDVYILGNHRLMCGDSTKKEDVDKLMNGQKADMVFTDPPYNVNYEGQDGMTIQNDNMSDENFKKFLDASFTNLYDHVKVGGSIYCCHADIEGLNFRSAMKNAGFKIAECLIWVKNSLVLGRKDYHWRHEPILYGWKEGAAHYFVDDRTQDTVWEYDKPRSNDLHPTMKPVELVARAIKNSSRERERVLDLFGGSGSTLIACEQLNRQCYIMELDPKYCDVIVKRYETLTGKKAIKL